MHTFVRRRRPLLSTLTGILIAVTLLFPLYWIVANSLQTNAAIFRTPAPLFPRPVDFHAYTAVFSDQWPHLLTSLGISVGTVLLSLAFAVPAAYALAHFRFRFSLLLVFCLLTAQMIPVSPWRLRCF